MQVMLVFHVYTVHNENPIKNPIGSFVQEFDGDLKALNTLLKEAAKKEGLSNYAILHQMIIRKKESP